MGKISGAVITYCLMGSMLMFACVIPVSIQAGTVSKVVTVKMNDKLKFEPKHVIIHQGETIQWKNTSMLVHTVTDQADLATNRQDANVPKGAKGFNSGKLAPGAIYRHTFTVPGHYRYFCIPHEAAGMTADITVKP